MTLAARCPACGTVFRVVQDQLRVSEGWVRCGRCAEVFNAIESLVEIEAEVPPRTLAAPEGRQRVLEELARVSSQAKAADRALPAAPSSPAPAPPAPTRAVIPREPSDDAAPATETAATAESELPDLQAEAGMRTAPAPAPKFLRRAERAARWRRPRVRLALAALAGGAAAMLAIQTVIEYRDQVAAHWPATRPTLEQACAALDCRIEAPRAIEALAVESSGLVRIEGTPMYRLSVVLRNRAALALALPAIDLALTDSQGSLIARRVVRLVELGVDQSSVPGLAEMPLQVTLSAAERAVSGYTIEIFYP